MKKKILAILLCITAPLLMFCSSMLVLPHVAFAESFSMVELLDQNFQLSMQANARNGNISLQENQQQITTREKEQITYHVFDWSKLESLTFNFENKTSSNNTFDAYLFVSHIQSEDLAVPIASFAASKETFALSGLKNSSSTSIFRYFVDSTSTQSSQTSANGHDFGLYEFTFSYVEYSQTNKQYGSLEPIYVAVLPDEVTNIENVQTNITFEVTSANELLNKFNCSLTHRNSGSFDLRYINPNLLDWQVVGTSKTNEKYCRDEVMKKTYPQLYDEHKTIKPIFEKHNGTTFSFDSNGIEGTWTISVVLTNPKTNEQKTIAKLENISTIKVPKNSNLWILWLVILLMIVTIISVAAFLIVKFKKSQKIW